MVDMKNTAKQMETSGEWAKTGRKHYTHVTGAVVTYNCNAWAWEVSTMPHTNFAALGHAKLEVEAAARKAGTVADMFA